MKPYTYVILLAGLISLAGCSVLPKLDDVLPDKRTEYKKSDSLPDLEVPPDLTSSSINDSMAIPNEPVTLSSQKARAAEPQVAATPDEQWVAVHRPRTELWPALRSYFETKGYAVGVDDAELGVLETEWGQPVTTASGLRHYKFRVFSEPGESPDVTILFISSQGQSGVTGDGNAVQWVDSDPAKDQEKVIAGDLNRLFNGAGATSVAAAPSGGSAAASTAPARPKPEFRDADGGVLLSLPDEYSIAWPRTDKALQRGGLFIEGRDEAKGLFMISYFKPAEEKKKGWLDKMKFWSSDEDKGKSYQVSITGVGKSTEVIIVNGDGDWDSSEDARRILSIVQNQYGQE